MPYTFPKSLHLRSPAEFAAVYDAKVRESRGPLLIYALPNGLDHPRLGLSTSRKVGTAVRRNRIRRLLREAFRHMRHDFPRGYDLVIVVRPHEPLMLAEYQRVLSGAVIKLHRNWTGARRVGGARIIMTQPPTAPALLAYQTPVPRRRPASVLVLATIGFVIATVGLLRFGALVALAISGLMGRAIFSYTTAWWYAQMLASAAFGVALFWICVAAIRMRPWARVAWLRWAKLYILWTVLQSVVTSVQLMPYVDLDAAENWKDFLPYIVTAVQAAVSCVYPSFVLFFMSRPHIRAAFQIDRADPPIPDPPLAGRLPA